MLAKANGLLALFSCGLLTSSCLVEQTCYQGDCPIGQRCIDNQCQVECTTDADCQADPLHLGKRCIANRCRFATTERIAAPELCLDVVNPKSGAEGQQRCLGQQKGKVVMLFFGLLA
jgi:hypothetical protein